MPDLIATSAFGLESVVARELHELGYADAKPTTTGRVAFNAPLDAICTANLWLRTADRLLLKVGTFASPDFDALFELTKSLPWEAWIPPDGAFPVSGRSVRSTLSSVPAVQRAVKRAVAERLLSAHNTDLLPETGATFPVEISLLKDTATLTLDTSGAGLHKRGYRTSTAQGQLRETMAAALLQLSFWEPGRPLIDPFCGTGTIPIEAALIATNTAPGINRPFVSETWPAIGKQRWLDARDQAEAAITDPPDERIIATDKSEQMLRMARHHAENAEVTPLIHFQQRDFDDLRTKRDFGCIVTNPPYGERLGEREEITTLYRTIPDVLRRLPTWSHFILTAHPAFERTIGQEADRRRKLYNAQIECTYFQFHGPPPPRPHDDTRPQPAPATNAPREEAAAPPSSRPPPPRTPKADLQPVFGGLSKHADTQADLFKNCLARRVKHLRKWPSRGITCYRLYDRNVPEVPLVVDRYNDHLHVAEHDRPHDHTAAQHMDWLERMLAVAADVTGTPPEQVHLKKRGRQRGLAQYERVDHRHSSLTVDEQGQRFEVNLTDYIDTGLFLDHRTTRAMVRDQARDTRFLNLFCYTGSFTVYAGAGGATATTSVDLSNTYLDWTRRNLLLNKLDGDQHELVRADVLDYLDLEARNDRQFDLVVADPPTFSNSKRNEEDWDVQRLHGPLLTRIAKLLAPGGTLYFSTNFRGFSLDDTGGLDAREISNRTVPEDFRNKRIHRCWKLRHAAPDAG